MRKKLGRSTNLVRPSDPPAPEGARIFDAVFPSDSDPERKTHALEGLLHAIAQSGVVTKDSELNALRLALDEALVNAIMHGNQYDANKSVQVSAHRSPTALTVIVSDQGAGFKEEDLPDPDAPENMLEESGRGVILIRGVMDEISYWRGGTTLVMMKRYPKSGAQT
jgi:serine/threonine-protein kinase RsbW